MLKTEVEIVVVEVNLLLLASDWSNWMSKDSKMDFKVGHGECHKKLKFEAHQKSAN